MFYVDSKNINKIKIGLLQTKLWSVLRSIILWFHDFSRTLGSSSSSSNWYILKFSVVIGSFVLALFMNFLHNLVTTKSSCPKRDMIECTSAVFTFFSVATQRGPPPPWPPSLPSHSIVKLASDWLGVGLELRSFCHWPTCQTGKNRNSEDWGVSTE